MQVDMKLEIQRVNQKINKAALKVDLPPPVFILENNLKTAEEVTNYVQ